MISFYVDNVFTRVDKPMDIGDAVTKYLTIKKDGFVKDVDQEEYRRTGRLIMKTFYKSDTICLYNSLRQTFPTGRLGYVTSWCQSQQRQYQIIDERKRPEPHLHIEYVGPPSDGSQGSAPRPYQTQATKTLLDHGGRGILWYATASGKTIVAAHIIADIGVTCLYVVPSLELLNQTQADLQSALKGIRIGKIGEGVWDPQPVTIATASTLWSRFEKQECKDFLSSREMLIADECHHVQTRAESGNRDKNKVMEKDKKRRLLKFNSWYLIAMNCNAYYRIGLTGTPGKDIEQKRALLECAIGRVIDRVSTKQLIEMGVAPNVEIHMHKIKHKLRYNEYADARKQGILLNDDFNRYVVQLAVTELKAGENVLILTGSKAYQGPALSKMFQDLGYDVPFVSGDDKRKARTKIREDFRSGKLKCLIGTVYGEGVDFPLLGVGILADGGKDEKKVIQFLGRILRKVKGKNMARLHDFLHDDGTGGFLKRHSLERLNTYVEEELEKIITHKGIQF